jgi:hypothetical protein
MGPKEAWMLDDDTPDQPAPIPILTPDQWGDFSVFRETFLLEFSDPQQNTVARRFGQLLSDLTLEGGVRPRHKNWPEPALRAAVADLRQLQGFLAFEGDPTDVDESEMTPGQLGLRRLSGRISQRLAKLVDAFEKEVDTLAQEESGR